MTFERALTQIDPYVWRIVADNPSPMTGPGTNTYLVGRERVVIIDPGPNLAGHLAEIVAALDTLRVTPEAIILTHPHPDHDGGIEALRQEIPVPLLKFGQGLDDHSLISLDCGALLVRHTPGHIHDHISLWWAEPGLLFAGDLVAGQGTIVVIPPDGDMADYLDSLRAMQALAPTRIFPGHGPASDTPHALLQTYIDHRLAREQQVLHWLAQGRTTAAAIAAAIYADQPPQVLPIATLQVEAHLIKLRREGRLAGSEGIES
ncbi:MAG: MBL fold metallo-hydrolase [Anaerolineaceae bacterium]|nr:MBL fold metallo-hydrolase [Anaerolineaceae bacterium]MCB9098471.1 MBL fold metallo-hydrolase [Anaerolineales bacterium]